jgi:hypothetical protein
LIFKIPAVLIQFQEVIACLTITVFKAVMKSMALGGFNYVGKKAEVIAKGEQGILMNPYFFISIKIGKDPPVLSQQSMDISHEVV